MNRDEGNKGGGQDNFHASIKLGIAKKLFSLFCVDEASNSNIMKIITYVLFFLLEFAHKILMNHFTNTHDKYKNRNSS